MHEILTRNISALDQPDLERYAKTIGLDRPRFRADLVGATVINQADVEQANAESVPVEFTTSFFFNGRMGEAPGRSASSRRSWPRRSRTPIRFRRRSWRRQISTTR
jgi:hypothetical protein